VTGIQSRCYPTENITLVGLRTPSVRRSAHRSVRPSHTQERARSALRVTPEGMRHDILCEVGSNPVMQGRVSKIKKVIKE
jgi:hypothetical protein